MISGTDTRQTNGYNGQEKVSPRGSGIVVLSSLLQPLYVNARAVRLLSDSAEMRPETLRPTNRGVVLPPILVDLAGKILSVLRQGGSTSHHGHCEMQCLTEHAQKDVLVRGVGLPRGNGVDGARIVFVLTEQDDHDGHAQACLPETGAEVRAGADRLSTM